jgi:glycosyltransferase involved in cell wall biosynthesis
MIKKVLFPFVGDSVGGSHLAALALIRRLDRGRVEPVVVLDRDGPLARKCDAERVAYAIAPFGALAGTNANVAAVMVARIVAAPNVASLLKRERIDIVHTSDLRCHLTWGPTARLLGCKWVWHLHQLLSGSALWAAPGALASRILAVSPQAAASVPAFVSAKTTVLPNGFQFGSSPDRGAAKSALAREIQIEPDRPIVAYVGNMTRQKRPLVFAEAARRVAKAAATAPCFVLVGDDRGGERGAVEASFAEAGLSAQARFLGYRDSVPDLLAAADILAAPGVGDSFGRTLVEALSVGTPVVASRSGGHSFIITHGETGLLVEPDDSESLAQGLLTLLTDKALARGLAKSGEHDVRTRFDAGAVTGEVMKIYDELSAA